MVAFTPKIRSSLLLDATRGSSLRRWSIRDLLEFRADGPVEQTTSLLHSLQIRLAVQHGRLAAFARALDDRAADPGHSSRKHLARVRQLHENTYCLPHQITRGDGQALLDDFSGPNRRYVATVVDELRARHVNSVETLAEAVTRARDLDDGDALVFGDEALETFLHSRLLFQLLCDHYVAVHKGKPAGEVALGADVAELVRGAVAEARHVCDANLGVAPEVRVGPRDGADRAPPPLIPSFLHYAVAEVTKNALASSLERWSRTNPSPESVPPSVHVRVGKDAPGFLSVQVLDQGVGLQDEARAFGFARTSARDTWDRLHEQQSYAMVRQPLGSLGVGLPLSRLMMRAFSGDLVVANRGRGRDLDSGCTATLSINYDDTFEAKN